MGTTATPAVKDGRPEFMPREFSFRKEEKKPEPIAKDTWWVEKRCLIFYLISIFVMK